MSQNYGDIVLDDDDNQTLPSLVGSALGDLFVALWEKLPEGQNRDAIATNITSALMNTPVAQCLIPMNKE